MRSVLRLLRSGALVFGLSVVSGATAAAVPRVTGCGRNRIDVRGPTANRANSFFNETVYGCAANGADEVISGEQRIHGSGCARTYGAEMRGGEFSQWPTGTAKVHGRFSLIARFYSHNPGTHGICSYLVNAATKETYARAGLFWTNA